MGTLFLTIFHVVIVAAIYITAYRTGYRSCQAESRRHAEEYTAPLTKMLEELNLDIERFLEDKKDR